jgi:radical SAM protein with 4Fe4S-binding SPASM domain
MAKVIFINQEDSVYSQSAPQWPTIDLSEKNPVDNKTLKTSARARSLQLRSEVLQYLQDLSKSSKPILQFSFDEPIRENTIDIYYCRINPNNLIFPISLLRSMAFKCVFFPPKNDLNKIDFDIESVKELIINECIKQSLPFYYGYGDNNLATAKAKHADTIESFFLKESQKLIKPSVKSLLPDRIDIIPAFTNCNIQCKMCKLSIQRVIEKSVISDETLEDIIRAIPRDYHGLISLTPFTETLQAREFFSWANKVKDMLPSVQIGFNTNCTLLSNENIERILGLNTAERPNFLSGITLSLNVCSKKDFEWFTGKDLFEKAIEGIKALGLRKRERSLRWPFLRLQLLDIPLNQGKFDSVISELQPFVDGIQLAKLDDNGGLVDVTTRLLSSEDNEAPTTLQSHTTPVCSAPWESLTINWDGDIFGCCVGGFNDLKKTEVHLGNVKTHSLENIWMGDKLKALRLTQILQYNNDSCSKCRRFGKSDEQVALELSSLSIDMINA